MKLPARTRRLPAALLLATAFALSGCAVHIGDDGGGAYGDEWREVQRAAIVRVLEDQAEAWNEGDIEEFMEGYWQSPDLVFTSGGRLQRGWQTTLDRYRSTYGTDSETMGTLLFSNLEIHPLAHDAAWVLGRWSLERGEERNGGIFTLVFERKDDRWVIVHDHTSVTAGD